MKKTIVIHWDIDITPQDEAVYSASSILNTKSDEFSSFEGSMIRMLEDADYLLHKQYDSNNIGSISKYYEFLKFTSDLKVKLLVAIRISDHKVPDKDVKGKRRKAQYIRRKYLREKRIPEIMDEFNLKERPIDVDVDIVFNDQHFVSYYEALEHINKLINTKLK